MIKEIQRNIHTSILIVILFIFTALVTEDNKVTIKAKPIVGQSEISFMNSSLDYQRNISYENLITKPKLEDKEIPLVANDSNQIIDIPDIQLKKIINRKLGKLETDDITLDELQSLITLDITESRIWNLEGLQYATNLERLRINNTTIIDISALGKGNFENLTELQLQNNQITDISALGAGNFKNLTWLELDSNQITDISALVKGNFKNLIGLSLSSNEISDISLLGEGNFENLKHLHLSSNQITDISSLVKGNFKNLTSLSLDFNQITDISVLGAGNFENLTQLNLRNLQITDISALGAGNFKNLTSLYLDFNQITDISALGEGNFENLTHLDLNSNQITDISALGEGDFKNLTTLYLFSNQITDISALGEGNFENLTELQLQHNQITDISVLEERNFGNLKYLDLSSNQITDISGLTNLPNLKTLCLQSNQITDMSSWNNYNVEIYAQYQQIILSEHKIKQGTISINNPIKGFINTKLNFNFISHNGIFQDNTFNWFNLEDNDSLSIEFFNTDKFYYGVYSGIIQVPIRSNTIPSLIVEDITIIQGNSFNEFERVSANDKEDGDLTSKIKIKENTVDTNQVGIYKVVYEVTDSDENTVTKEIKVTVVGIPMVFSDIEVGRWYTSHIQEFVSLGYINGYGDGTFKPQNPITRAEFVKIVNKAFELSDKYAPVTNLPFTDLDSQWKKDELRLALAAGYITPATEFRHNAPINRQEAAKIIGYLLGDKLINHSNWEFIDSDEIATWAQDYVAGLVEAEVLSKNESFRPKEPITRAEAVKMLNIARGL